MDPAQNSIRISNLDPYSLVFSSANPHKIEEVRSILGSDFRFIGLHDLDITEEIEETGNTFQDNAKIKAEYVFKRTGLDVFADDSGLEVDALEGAPGVYSARYAPSRIPKENLEKVLREMQDQKNRKARFITCICLFYKGEITFFEGTISGEILFESRGHEGFGYDPIFKPLGHSLSFSEMSLELKNQISHRSQALNRMKNWIEARKRV